MDSGFEARKILRGVRSGSLATKDRETGTPYVSFCAMGHDFEGRPLFLFSDLADHTQNLMKDGNASFLCEQASHLSNPQAGPRITLVGTIAKTSEADVASLFLQAHPSSRMYANFEDFNFYSLNVEKVHYVGGFGRAVWLNWSEYMGESRTSLEFFKIQKDLLETIKRDFGSFARICATKLLKQGGEDWHVLRVDADGLDLKLGAKVMRYPFEKPLKKASEVLEIISKISM